MNTITEFRRRFEVQIADSIPKVMGGDMQGYWRFHLGFHTETDAMAAAERLSEDNRWVRVVDINEEEGTAR